MSTKRNPGQFDAYAKALPDEPIFVLLGRDSDAPDLLRMWAAQREAGVESHRRPREDLAAARDARRIADAMEFWRDHKRAVVRREPRDDGTPGWVA